MKEASCNGGTAFTKVANPPGSREASSADCVPFGGASALRCVTWAFFASFTKPRGMNGHCVDASHGSGSCPNNSFCTGRTSSKRTSDWRCHAVVIQFDSDYGVEAVAQSMGIIDTRFGI